MRILGFDEADIVGTLERLPQELRMVFAAACAERFLPACVVFCTRTGRGEPATLRSILSRLWDGLDGDQMTDSERQAGINACMDAIPKEEDGQWVLEQSAADDAAAAVAYALTCRQNGQAQEPGIQVATRAAPPSPAEGLSGGGFEVMAGGSDYAIRWWIPFYLP